MRSSLEIYRIATGQTEVVWQSRDLYEAPNWDPDGKSFVINGMGRIFRLPVTGGDPVQIDTGYADGCNNDHGISPDGKTILISHKPGDEGSVIYSLPATGGTPRRVTPKAPSYWHGWSPDGEQIAYCARRAGRYEICVSRVDGADEVQLTGVGGDEGHNDGPDYSPDGAWIWFNSDRSGRAQIWKMRPDGSDVTRMTDDGFVNWFPHPSPCGTHVLYLAYPEGTLYHPRDLDVGLMLMSPDGSNAREVARFNGGQGSINVPCWSPDGSAFAYMRYGPD